MDAFAGTWTINPADANAVSGDKEAFKAMKPPGFQVPEEAMRSPHTVVISVSGNNITLKLNIAGHEKEETFTIGGTTEKTLPNGVKIQATSKFEGGKLFVNMKGPDHQADIVRSVSGNNMFLDITKDGKSCRATFNRA